MTIQLTQARYINGSLAASGSQHTLDEATEAGLIYQGMATRVGDAPSQAGDVNNAVLSTDANGYTVLAGADGVENPVGVCIATVGIATDFSVPINNGANKIAWDGGLVINTTGSNAVWTAGASSKLVVPTGFKKARVTSQIRLDDAFAGQSYTNHISLDGSLTYSGVGLEAGERNDAGALIIQAQTSWLSVTAGKYFETFVLNSNATTQNWILGTVRSWFQIELMR